MYIHTYIHTYGFLSRRSTSQEIHTYIHTYIHTSLSCRLIGEEIRTMWGGTKASKGGVLLSALNTVGAEEEGKSQAADVCVHLQVW